MKTHSLIVTNNRGNKTIDVGRDLWVVVFLNLYTELDQVKLHK